MTLPPDRERVRQILSETIGLLCRNGLSFDVELSVDALIGITVDHKDVFLISIKDTYDSERNLQQPFSKDGATAVQLLSICGQKGSCSILDSALKCNFPSSMTNAWSCAEKNSSSEKESISSQFCPAQPCSKRLIERNEFPGDQTKRARISDCTDAETPRVEPTLLTVVKSEPCDALLATDTFGTTSGTTTSCAKPCNYSTTCNSSITNSSTNHEQFTSRSISLVKSKLNCIMDSVRLKIRVPVHNENSTVILPDVSCAATERNSDDAPSKSIVLQNKSNEVSSRLPSASNDDVSNFDKQSISDCPEASSNLHKPGSPLSSNSHTQNISVASRYHLQVPSVSHSGRSAREKRANSEGSSDGLDLQKPSYQTKSYSSIHRGKSNELIYDSHEESGSSDSEVICVKEEIPYVPFNSSSSFHADPRSSVQNRLKDDALALSTVDSLNLETFSYDRSLVWKGMQSNLFHPVRRQQRDSWSSWNHHNVVPSSFTDPQSLEKLLIQAAQSILLYDGRYVPLRDIQRLRLCGMAAGQIKLAMEQLSSYDGKLGCFQVLHGGVNLFYKCPPNLVDREILESSYCIPWDTYKFHYDVTPASNITTRHNEQYWLKVASSSPYNSSSRALHVA